MSNENASWKSLQQCDRRTFCYNNETSFFKNMLKSEAVSQKFEWWGHYCQLSCHVTMQSFHQSFYFVSFYRHNLSAIHRIFFVVLVRPVPKGPRTGPMKDHPSVLCSYSILCNGTRLLFIPHKHFTFRTIFCAKPVDKFWLQSVTF